MDGAMNEEDALTLEELERDIETLQEFLKAEKSEAAVFEEPEKVEEPKAVEEPAAVVEAPKTKSKSKPKPKAKKVEEEIKPAPTPIPAKAEAPVRLYGAAKLRAKRGH